MRLIATLTWSSLLCAGSAQAAAPTSFALESITGQVERLDQRPLSPLRPMPTTIFGLPQNMGPGDRILRGAIAVAMASVGIYGLASHRISGAVSGTLLGVSIIPGATAATGYCPLYQAAGVERSF